jgi:putative zinc finger/helix-turn-helix YgiT family protein
MNSLPYPRKCPKCHERKVVRVKEDYCAVLEHDGITYNIVVPDLELLKCEACGNIVLDDAANEKLDDALRAAAGLMPASEIGKRRMELEMSQGELARLIQVDEATLKRWESGLQIPANHTDILLRAYFDCPEFRRFLEIRMASTKAEATTEAAA